MPDLPKCEDCGCGGPLVRLTASRSDTGEVLDTVYFCPECFVLAGTDLFTTVVLVDPNSGVAYLSGSPGPQDG